MTYQHKVISVEGFNPLPHIADCNWEHLCHDVTYNQYGVPTISIKTFPFVLKVTFFSKEDSSTIKFVVQT